MKGKKRRRHTHYSGPPTAPAEHLAARLAPPEEHDPKAAAQVAAAQSGGAIIVDTGAPQLPEGLGAARKSRRLLADRVVVILVALALLFTSFVAWRVSKMRDEPTPVQIVQPE